MLASRHRRGGGTNVAVGQKWLLVFRTQPVQYLTAGGGGTNVAGQVPHAASSVHGRGRANVDGAKFVKGIGHW
jgi:hypothetical protein